MERYLHSLMLYSSTAHITCTYLPPTNKPVGPGPPDHYSSTWCPLSRAPSASTIMPPTGCVGSECLTPSSPAHGAMITIHPDLPSSAPRCRISSDQVPRSQSPPTRLCFSSLRLPGHPFRPHTFFLSVPNLHPRRAWRLPAQVTIFSGRRSLRRRALQRPAWRHIYKLYRPSPPVSGTITPYLLTLSLSAPL